MTTRDRIVLIVIALVAVLGAAWMLVVSPERKQATQLGAQVTSAQSQLASAESEVARARTAQSQYTAAYASVVSLGKAVPPSEEVPALIYQLSHATSEKDVSFNSIASTTGSSSSSPAAGSSETSSSSTAGASAASSASASFASLPFTFSFEGSYFDLEHLFRQLTDFATLSNAGTIQVSGRLLTINSVKLAIGSSSASNGKATTASKLTGSVSATAYVLPASQGLTGSATATSPTGASAPAAATAPSSPTPTATVKVNP